LSASGSNAAGSIAARKPPPLAVVLTGMVALQIFTTMALNSPFVLGPVVLQELGVSPGVLGYYVPVILVAAMLGSLMGGAVIRKLGPLRAAQAGAWVMVAALALSATGIPLAMFLAAAALGAGVAPITPANTQILARITPPHRLGLAFALRQSGLPIGIGLLGVVVPALLLHMNWQGTLLVLAAGTAVLALAVQPMRAALDADREPAAKLKPSGLWTSLGELWRDPALRGVALCITFYSVGQTVLLVYAVSYLTLELHYGLAAAGAMFSIMQVSALPSRLAWGWVSDRTGDPVRVLGALGVLSAIFLALLSTASAAWPLPAMGALFAFGGATLAGWNGLYFAAIGKHVPAASVGTVTGAMQMFTYLGGLAGPPICAAAIGWTGRYSSVYLGSSVFMLLVGAWVMVVLPRRRGAPAS